MKLDIILRTHDKRNVHMIGSRSVDASKSEIILRCANSLSKTIKACGAEINLTVIDDHSEQSTIDGLHNILDDLNPKFIHLELTGNNASMLEWYILGKDSKADIVYCVEDDYLHDEIALTEMVYAFETFRQNLGFPPALFPIDDPDNYRPPHIEECRVVPGQNILWRTNIISTGTMFVEPKLIADNWNRIHTLATQYGIISGFSEETMYHPIWTKYTKLFTPLYPLAYHLNEWTHPVFDHLPLWETNKL